MYWNRKAVLPSEARPFQQTTSCLAGSAPPRREKGDMLPSQQTETESGSFLQTTALIETDLNYAPANIKY